MFKKTLAGDLSGALTTMVTSLPLALAFGVASGAGPVAGLYGTICLGLIASIFGGCPPQISAPNTAMTAIMTTLIAKYSHDPNLVFTIIMMAGMMQIILGWLGIGRYLSLVPTPVISGFMTGVGIYIILMQIGRFFGHATQSDPIANILAVPAFLENPRWDASYTVLLTLGILWGMPKKIAKYVPGSIVALLTCSLAAYYLFTEAPCIHPIPTVWPNFQIFHIDWQYLPDMLQSALAIASLGSVYSLIAAMMVDNALGTTHASNRELIGQGIGNIVSALCGGLAGNGAPIRTMINVRAGARTRLSGITYALMMFTTVLGIGSYAHFVPISLLAGILIKAGGDIIDWPYLKNFKKTTPFEQFMYVTVIGLTIFADLVTAMFVGMTIFALWHVVMYANDQRLRLQILPILHTHSKQTIGSCLEFKGHFSYGFSLELSRLLSQLNAATVLIFDFSQTTSLDSTLLLNLKKFLQQRQSLDRHSFITGLSETLMQLFKDFEITTSLPTQHIILQTQDAQKYIEQHILPSP